MRKIQVYSIFVVLLLLLSSVAYCDIFIDTFDDHDFTNNNWSNFTDNFQSWSFVIISESNIGYHGSTANTQSAAAKIANNGCEYYSAGLYVETLVRIDSHSNAYSSDHGAGLAFAVSQGKGYFAGVEMDYVGQPEVHLNIGVVDGEDIDKTTLPINFDTFYKLIVQVDSTQNASVYLYELNGTLLGSVFASNVLSINNGAVAIWGAPEVTFDDFKLTGNPVIEKATLTSPSGTTEETTPTFTWNEDPSSTWYRLLIWDSSGEKVYSKWYDSSIICSDASCSVTIESELASDNYQWWVNPTTLLT